MKELTIQVNDANQRLDKFLFKTFPELKSGMLYKALRKKKIKINRKLANYDQNLQSGDQLQLLLPHEILQEKQVYLQKNAQLNVVYEDDNIVVIDKPAGLLSQSSKEQEDCVVERLKSYLYQKKEYDPKSEHHFKHSFGNRLDRNKSGFIIGAKNDYASREINAAIQDHRIHKYYNAYVEGHVEKEGLIVLYLQKRETKAYISPTFKEGYQKAVMKIYPYKYENGNTWIKVELITGRFHQIRASMAYLGHPLVGDRKYGSLSSEDMKLDAYKIKIDPIEMEFETNEFTKK